MFNQYKLLKLTIKISVQSLNHPFPPSAKYIGVKRDNYVVLAVFKSVHFSPLWAKTTFFDFIVTEVFTD